MTIEVIFNKKTVSGFTFDSAKGAYKASLSGAFTLTAGQYYEIGWDGKTCTRKAYTLNGDSTVYIGNELRQKGEIDDITELFIIAYVPGTNQNLFYAYDTSSSHIVGISTAEEPNSVLVKDWHGKDHEFTGHDTVYIRNAGGDAQPYTHGFLGSDIETPANFSGGDMVLSADDGDFVKKATVLKPENLKPENIAKDVEIAGVVGNLVADTEEVTAELNFSDYVLVKDAAAMEELLCSRDNIGKYVKYVGTDGEYTKEQVYKLVDEYEAFDSADCSEAAVEIASGTELTATIECKVGDLIVAAFVIRSPLVSLSDGWTLIETSQPMDEINTTFTIAQTLSFAYKYAETTTESITVTQETANRCYINMVSFGNAVGFADAGYQYQDNSAVTDATAASFNRPDGKLVLWGVTRSYASTAYPDWSISNDSKLIQLDGTTVSRLLLAVDSSADESVTFSLYSENQTDAYICGALVIELTQNLVLKAVDQSEVPVLDSQTIEAAEDIAISKVTLNKPKTLIPENIAEGVDIGGIIGTLVGGSKVKITTGIVTTAQTSAAVTVNHGLGVVPDMVIAWGASGTSRTYFAIAVSKAFTALYGFDRYVAALYTSNQKTNSYFVGNLDGDSVGGGCVGMANETTFVYQGSTTYKIPANAKWLAIAGLT